MNGFSFRFWKFVIFLLVKDDHSNEWRRVQVGFYFWIILWKNFSFTKDYSVCRLISGITGWSIKEEKKTGTNFLSSILPILNQHYQDNWLLRKLFLWTRQLLIKKLHQSYKHYLLWHLLLKKLLHHKLNEENISTSTIWTIQHQNSEFGRSILLKKRKIKDMFNVPYKRWESSIKEVM